MGEEAVAPVVKNKQVVLARYINGVVNESDLELKLTTTTLKLQNNLGSAPRLLVKNLYLSCDPYMRGRMHNLNVSYLPSFTIGSPIQGFGVSRVVESEDPDFKPGDLVSGMTGWEEYSVVQKNEQFRKIQPDNDIPFSYYVGLLVCAPKKGDYLFVSAALGGVGQVVGQLAKLQGCYVVGSAGSDQKVDMPKNKLGFDEAFNYKEEPDINAALKRYFPQGIDIYFDHVGGAMLDAVLLNMRVHGRIGVCGMISQQSLTKPSKEGVRNLGLIIAKRLKIQGILQSDYLHLFPHFLKDVTNYIKQGKIMYAEDVKHGLESAPFALVGLFSSKNVGKQIVHVASE